MMSRTLEHLKFKISKAFNEEGMWDCEHCCFRNAEPKVCLLCDRISRAFIWFEWLEETFNRLKEMNVEFVDEKGLKEYIFDKLIGASIDSSMATLQDIVWDFRKFFKEDKKVKLDVCDDHVTLYLDCSNEVLKKIKSKYENTPDDATFKICIESY